jgi:uncharacterized membrane protein
MNTVDLITIIGNISQSLYPVQKMISGLAYILGIIFFYTAIEKLLKIGDKRTQSSSHDKMYTPVMYLFMGALLVYLPSALPTMAATAFGVGNVLTYASYNPLNVYSSVGLLIRTVGVIWFVRGCVLVAHASNPGTQHGPKGLLFMIAGIFAMNFDNSIAAINWFLNYLIKITVSVKDMGGY